MFPVRIALMIVGIFLFLMSFLVILVRVEGPVDRDIHEAEQYLSTLPN